jgi:hypothetical protein
MGLPKVRSQFLWWCGTASAAALIVAWFGYHAKPETLGFWLVVMIVFYEGAFE